jgi:lipoprotein-releasing system permease protein
MFPTHLERTLAWRMLRAKRSEGGASVAALVSIVGVALAVFALVVTLAVRAGFRAEFVGTMLGANPHVTAVAPETVLDNGRIVEAWSDPEATTAQVAAVPGVLAAWPAVRGAVMIQHGSKMGGADVHGVDLRAVEALDGLALEQGSWEAMEQGEGVAIGARLAEFLGVQLGDSVRLVSPDGARTAFGVTPRVEDRTIVAVFTGGRYDIDRSRLMMGYGDAQVFFNREGLADEVQTTVADPEGVDPLRYTVLESVGGQGRVWSWKDAAAGFLRALQMEDTVMKVILSVLVLVSSMAIVSGLVMLARNKRTAVGILRTVGLSRAGVLRTFLIVGVATGTTGALLGAAGGVFFAAHIDAVLAWLDGAAGGGVWDASVRGVYTLPALVQAPDVVFSVLLAIGLAALASLLPALSAARLDPVEALRDGD